MINASVQELANGVAVQDGKASKELIRLFQVILDELNLAEDLRADVNELEEKVSILIQADEPVAVADLPVSAAAGKRMAVNDAAAPVFGSVVVGGGSTVVPVYFDGSNWIVG